MKALKSRQRGHGSYGILTFLIPAMPWIVGLLGVGFLALLGWAVWRLCK